MDDKNNSNLMVPLSIVIAGLFVAGAVYLTNGQKAPSDDAEVNQGQQEEVQDPSLEAFNPVDEKDHILGDRNAPVIVVEYSDFECSFCARAHTTLKTLVDEYDGKVAWVYRHFPLSQIHPDAEQLAIASECIAVEGGNEAFWKFSDGVFAQNTKGEEAIISLSNQIGVDGEKIRECLKNNQYRNDVINDSNNAVQIGAQGTPYVVVVGPNEVKAVVNGAQPIEVFRQVVDTMLEQQ